MDSGTVSVIYMFYLLGGSIGRTTFANGHNCIFLGPRMAIGSLAATSVRSFQHSHNKRRAPCSPKVSKT